MKKLIPSFLIITIILLGLFLLPGCATKIEYDEKEILSIHYYTTQSEMPWQDHQYYDFTEMTYATKHIIMEGYEDPEANPAIFEREEYSVKAILDSNQADKFFKSIKRHGIYNIESHYFKTGVYDGSTWDLIISFTDGTTFLSGGYMKYPTNAKKLDGDFEDLSGYKLFGIWAYDNIIG